MDVRIFVVRNENELCQMLILIIAVLKGLESVLGGTGKILRLALGVFTRVRMSSKGSWSVALFGFAGFLIYRILSEPPHQINSEDLGRLAMVIVLASMANRVNDSPIPYPAEQPGLPRQSGVPGNPVVAGAANRHPIRFVEQ